MVMSSVNGERLKFATPVSKTQAFSNFNPKLVDIILTKTVVNQSETFDLPMAATTKVQIRISPNR